ncbi:MAG: hypothetical protein V1835_03540 [Candidatus Micrarchaeota archaeon]
MKKHERILERRRIFKQELLRPLMAMMYYEIKAKALKAKERRPPNHPEDLLLEKLTLLSESFHDFLQSHEFTHHEKLSEELMEKLMGLKKAIRELGSYYELHPEKPELFDALPRGATQMRREIEKFSAFEKRNEAYSE